MRADGGVGKWRGALVGALLLLAGVALPVEAQARSAAPGERACEVRDPRLTELSGMVATDDGFVMINDGADDEARRRIFFLDRDCAVVRAVPYPTRPLDTEDLAVGADGTVWVADVGDNDRSRETIAVWKLAPGADRPVLHRMRYPDGPHDAEAMLVTGDGRPVVVTKFSANLYAPTAALRPGVTVPLAKVGQVKLPASTTSNPYGLLGRSAVTGAATAPDGRRVVLRTYADAFEFDVADGDVIAALTGGTPRATPLPDEPQGESVSYSPDGRSLLTVSETADQPAGTRPTVLRYPLTAAAPSGSPARTPEPIGPTPIARSADGTDGDITVVSRAAMAAGALGVLLIAVALVARARRRTTSGK
ncbi:esterase-like activity of phytase family protein [Micromonospora avicenniae]|uniref:WD40-like Beta Propeller Repeat n=1 Tax=Micromonospora avicenniae TaxID=1198245 RepID=A0A1N6WQW6_9ACTN|nr:esterase-like activity of phytase family protein [Micromonospora avicenniae]SIQ92417.1 hypothetical protein SAMN05444858_10573 [Micromonospora avicenniae]